MFICLKSVRKIVIKFFKIVWICFIFVDFEYMIKDELNYIVLFYKWYKKVYKLEYYLDIMYSFVICL